MGYPRRLPGKVAKSHDDWREGKPADFESLQGQSMMLSGPVEGLIAEIELLASRRAARSQTVRFGVRTEPGC